MGYYKGLNTRRSLVFESMLLVYNVKKKKNSGLSLVDVLILLAEAYRSMSEIFLA